MRAATAVAPAADYWDALESLDADLVASHFDPRGSFQLGNTTPVAGRDGLVVADSDLSLTFNDGTRLMLPATTILWTRDSEILNCRLLLDLEPCLLRATV